ncbi:hypothetical protein Tco_1407143 [Tanacetum coccineum]
MGLWYPRDTGFNLTAFADADHAGRSIAAPQGGRTGGRAGRGGGRTGVPTGRVGGRTGDQDSQGGNRGNGSNGGVDKVLEFSTVIAQQLQNLRIIIASNFQSDVRNVSVNNNRVQDMSGCGDNQKVKYTAGSFIEEFSLNNEMQKLETEFWCHAMVEAVHAAYIDRIHELARLVPYLVILENKRIERYIYGLLPMIVMGGLQLVAITFCMDYARDDNKEILGFRVFAIVTNPVRKEYMGTAPKCTNCNYHHLPEVPCRMYTNCNCFGHFAKDCRVGPMMVKMDDPNITMEEYIRLEEEKARRRGKVYNWETVTYGKIWYDEDVRDLRSVETEFPVIVFNDSLTFEETPSCEPTVSPLNDNKIDFRISFDESDDEDYTVIYDKNSFSYKIISVNDLKMDSENDNDKVNMPSFPSPKPMVSYFDDLDFFKDFKNEFPAIVYNDALTSKSDFLTEPTINIQHIDEFNLKDETSLSECNEEEQNILYFNDLFPFNVIYPDDSKSDKDNDDDKIDIK